MKRADKREHWADMAFQGSVGTIAAFIGMMVSVLLFVVFGKVMIGGIVFFAIAELFAAGLTLYAISKHMKIGRS